MSRSVAVATYVLLSLAIALGVFVRIHDIAARSFFSDEAFSVLRVTGHTEAGFRRLVDDRARPVAAIAAFQQADRGTSVAATLHSIGAEEPQRGPLYYSLATLWLGVTGTSIVGIRSLAVTIGVLAIGAAFLFGRIFFRDPLAGAILAGLVSLSPFHSAYARQAREYGLLTVVILLGATTLVSAMRGGRAREWIFFAATCALGMLTSPFFALVLVSYGLFALATLVREPQRKGPIVAFVVSAIVAVVASAPWYAFVAGQAGRVSDETSWGGFSYPIAFYATKIAFDFGAVFYDFEFGDVGTAVALVPVFVAAAYLAVLAIRARAEGVGFALALALPTALVLVANDVRTGAHFGTIARYGTPVWIAVEIAVTAGICIGLRSVRRTSFVPVVAAAVLLLGAGAFCVFADAPYPTWWDNNDNVPTEAVAAAANARPNAIIVASELPLVLALVHYLHAPLRVQLYAGDAPAFSPSGHPNLLFLPSTKLRSELAAGPRGNEMREIVPISGRTAVGAFHSHLISATGSTNGLDFISPENALWALPPSGLH